MQFEATRPASLHSSRYRNAEEALRYALARWEEDQRRRMELSVAFDENEADIGAGNYTDHANDTLSQLADELKRETRAERDKQLPTS
jgi:Arc/MetJ-type ribon-helix-helix transcriptional regulator